MILSKKLLLLKNSPNAGVLGKYLFIGTTSNPGEYGSHGTRYIALYKIKEDALIPQWFDGYTEWGNVPSVFFYHQKSNSIIHFMTSAGNVNTSERGLFYRILDYDTLVVKKDPTTLASEGEADTYLTTFSQIAENKINGKISGNSGQEIIIADNGNLSLGGSNPLNTKLTGNKNHYFYFNSDSSKVTFGAAEISVTYLDYGTIVWDDLYIGAYQQTAKKINLSGEAQDLSVGSVTYSNVERTPLLFNYSNGTITLNSLLSNVPFSKTLSVNFDEVNEIINPRIAHL